MDNSDSSDISHKLSNMKFRSPKKNRNPLQEKNTIFTRKSRNRTDYSNMGDYTFHDRKEIEDSLGSKTSKYNGLRVYSDKCVNVDSDEKDIEKMYEERRSWNRSRNSRKHEDSDDNCINRSGKKNINKGKVIRRKDDNTRFDHNSDGEDEECTLIKLQNELNSLRKKQNKIISSKENALSIIKTEVERVRREMEIEREDAMDILTKKHENEMWKRERSFREYKDKTKEIILKYKEACIGKIKFERSESNRKICQLKVDCEEKVKRYKNAFLALKERYKKDVLNL